MLKQIPESAVTKDRYDRLYLEHLAGSSIAMLSRRTGIAAATIRLHFRHREARKDEIVGAAVRSGMLNHLVRAGEALRRDDDATASQAAQTVRSVGQAARAAELDVGPRPVVLALPAPGHNTEGSGKAVEGAGQGHGAGRDGGRGGAGTGAGRAGSGLADRGGVDDPRAELKDRIARENAARGLRKPDRGDAD
ncbi:hypothetical protein [Maricaulis sp. CAU 1757]